MNQQEEEKWIEQESDLTKEKENNEIANSTSESNESNQISEEKNLIEIELEKKNKEDQEKLAKMDKNQLWYNHIKINREYYYRRANSNINMAFVINIFTFAILIFIIVQLSTRWNELKSSGNKLPGLFTISGALLAFSGLYLYNGIINIYLFLAVRKFLKKDPQHEDNGIQNQFDEEIMKLVKKYVKFGLKKKPIFQSII